MFPPLRNLWHGFRDNWQDQSGTGHTLLWLRRTSRR